MSQLTEFITNHWMLWLALVAVIVLLIGTEVQRRLRNFKDIGPMEAIRLGNHDNAVILDVREEAEFKGGSIPNAIHIPLSGLASRIQEIDQYKGQPIITVCRSGQRSATACGQLQKQGFEAIYNLSGGITAWQSANLPIKK